MFEFTAKLADAWRSQEGWCRESSPEECREGWESVGLRGVRVGESQNPGPRNSFLKRG